MVEKWVYNSTIKLCGLLAYLLYNSIVHDLYCVINNRALQDSWHTFHVVWIMPPQMKMSLIRFSSFKVNGLVNHVARLCVRDEKLWWQEEAYAISKRHCKMTYNCNFCHGGQSYLRMVICRHLNPYGRDPTLRCVKCGCVRLAWSPFNSQANSICWINTSLLWDYIHVLDNVTSHVHHHGKNT